MFQVFVPLPAVRTLCPLPEKKGATPQNRFPMLNLPARGEHSIDEKNKKAACHR
jgi:hypothetical protein